MHIKWTKIGAFHNVRKTCIKWAHVTENRPPKVIYQPKIKLHGTNAGIRIESNGQVTAQSRIRDLTPFSDNYGFAHWVEENKDFFSDIKSPGENNSIIVYGEWAGQGINSGCAVHQVEKKFYAIFAIELYIDVEERYIIFDPDDIREWIFSSRQERYLPEDIYILPWEGNSIEVDYASEESVDTFIEACNKKVKEVEEQDPWVLSLFQKEGIGEGLVYYPIQIKVDYDDVPVKLANNWTDILLVHTYIFKAKGLKHKTQHTPQPINKNPIKEEKLEDFANMFVTEARLLQGVEEGCNGKYDQTLTGSFIEWISKDIQSECLDDLIESSLTWKPVAKAISRKASKWYLEETWKRI